MEKIIIFDLYDTILKDLSFDFVSGLDYLYKEYFSKACTYEELKEYSEGFLPLYNERTITNKEISFTRQELAKFCEKFKVNPKIDEEELDYIIMNQMQKVCVLKEVQETLRKLQDDNVSMYILSNSIFLASSHKKLLEDFGVDKYFKNLFCSADFGIRKPDRRIYDYAIDMVLKDNKGITKDQIYYAGNDYKTDVKGSKDAGLKSIWYNVNHGTNTEKYEIWDIDSFAEIYNILVEK